MNAAIRLRRLTEDDLPFADTLRVQAGWNQTLADWRRLLRMNPAGCFLAEWNGSPAGTATTTLHGDTLAWIGMVLVEVSHRNRGIGRALLEQCLAYLQRSGVRCIKLDATPLGKPVYEAMGFQAEWTLARWESSEARKLSAAVGETRDWSMGDAARARELDVAAFGASRERLLAELARDSSGSLVVRAAAGAGLAGYGLLRPGSSASYLGPITAGTMEAAKVLVDALLAQCETDRVFWDIPDGNRTAVSWAEACGFKQQRPLTRMYWGENVAAGDPGMQYAIAGPEIG